MDGFQNAQNSLHESEGLCLKYWFLSYLKVIISDKYSSCMTKKRAECQQEGGSFPARGTLCVSNTHTRQLHLPAEPSPGPCRLRPSRQAGSGARGLVPQQRLSEPPGPRPDLCPVQRAQNPWPSALDLGSPAGHGGEMGDGTVRCRAVGVEPATGTVVGAPRWEFAASPLQTGHHAWREQQTIFSSFSGGPKCG